MPQEFLTVIQHAYWILDIQENLSFDEQPEDWMWQFPDEIEQHLGMVERERKARFSTTSDESDDPEDWQSNDLAAGIRD